MQLIYDGKDITDAVEIQVADIMDNAGGIADSVEIHFDDPKGVWSQWEPKKNDKIQLNNDSNNSGIMHVDELEQQRGIFVVKALSIPQEAKTTHTKGWEEVRFLEIANEIASKYGFKLETYGIQNHLYNRVDQYEQADFVFLAHRCALEGYMLKITDGKVVIYDEKYMESLTPVRTINADEFDGNYSFKSISTGIYGSCKITHGNIYYTFKPSNVYGPQLNVPDVYISSQGEAERYSKGLLRFRNKYENVGYIKVELDPTIAAGNTIQIQGVGLSDGKYFCNQVTHKLVDNKTVLRLRKPLEGY